MDITPIDDATRRLSPTEEETQPRSAVHGDGVLSPGPWGHWEIREHLGTGGYGDVYRAFDTRLERDVALKVLRVEGSIHLRRFMEESRIQGSLEHPAIIRIYEVGSIQDPQGPNHPFIAMQLVHGCNFREAAARMTLLERVEVLRQVVEGLHAAHTSGLIHRDIKPSNILVEQAEDGSSVAFLSDFGLAVSAQSPALTQSGVVVGTPHFMSPEQARGTRTILDIRTDIYSLGATLYDVITGRPPFSGESGMDVLLALLSEDPAPPRSIRPEIPHDLEAIVLKCMEKDPERRYESARALARDLEAFLAGNQVSARPLSRAQRALRWGQRHRWAAALGLVILLGVVGFTGYILRLQALADTRARLADRFSLEAERIDGMLRLSALKPIHDASPVRDLVFNRMAWIEGEMARHPKASLGPGHYALGRARLALGDPEEALKHLERAWRDHGFQTPSVAFAYGLALTRVYPARLIEAERQPGEARKAALEKLDAHTRTPALQLLAQGRESSLEDADWVEAHVALLHNQFDECARRVDTALPRVPFPVEALLLKGEAKVAQANGFRDQGNGAKALACYQVAREAFRACIASAPSDPRGYVGLGDLALAAMQFQIYQVGRSPLELHREAVAAFSSALAVDGRFRDALERLGMAHNRLGEHHFIRGEDAAPALAEAERVIGRALAIRPTERTHQFALFALVLRILDEDVREGGLQAIFERGLKHVQAIEGLGATRHQSLNTLGAYWLFRGRMESLLGKTDPEPAFTKAEEAFTRSAQYKATAALPWSNLAMLAYFRMDHRERIGIAKPGDAEPGLQAVVQAVTVLKGFSNARMNRCVLLVAQAQVALALGESPDVHLGACQQEVANLEGDPTTDTPNYWITLGSFHGLRAARFAQRGLDPLPAWNKALDLLDRAARLRPRCDTIGRSPHLLMATLHLEQARWTRSRGKDSGMALRRAAEALEKAKSLGYADVAERTLLEGRLELARHQGTKALEKARLARSEAPGRVEARVLEIHALEYLGRGEEALALRHGMPNPLPRYRQAFAQGSDAQEPMPRPSHALNR